MKTIWPLFYNSVVIPLIWSAYQILGLMNEKVRRGIEGRRGLGRALSRMTGALPDGERIWFHASSMGEFEQAKVIIAALRERRPDSRIIVTFFSPSGYEHSGTSPLADVVSYLPFDSSRGARMFVDTVRPDLGVLVRYDIWPNHIRALRRHGIPLILANATLNRFTVRRFPLVRSFHRSVYNDIDEILTVSENDAEAFRLLSLDRPVIAVVGDTRFDQVTKRSRDARAGSLLPEHVRAGRVTVVAGSCWPGDDDALLPAFAELLAEDLRILLVHVPHEPTERNLRDLEEKIPKEITVCRFSNLENYRGENMIIVDSIGKLLSLYASAHVAFIGGGFGKGIHNTLEAAVFGIPVLFGPRHYNSQEPLQLVERGGGFVVENGEELKRTLGHLIRDAGAREYAGRRSAEFVSGCTGATGRVVSRLEQYLSPGGESPRVSSGVPL